MEIKNITPLPCQCGNTWFSPIQQSQYSDFNNSAPSTPIRSVYLYVCTACGTVKGGQEPPNDLLVITGISEGYKRKAQVSYGLEPQSFKRYITVGKVSFVTLDAYEAGEIDSGLYAKVIDVSQGDFSRLKQFNVKEQ